ncbi:MAG: 5-(carboxyamino)imidazole ribonucleotide mutase [Polyangia bacterium]|jgi:5-(carboxyamino)imidazole ribonucleotide mutase|nr:5-(carboxyamino)imidazole ribonucleotide mutase [Polyangia bacterium]
MGNVQVAVVMGSDSDLMVMEKAADVLKELGIGFEVRVISAHRTPAEAKAFADGLEERGVQVVIAAAGGAAHLAGVMAAHTMRPVIGVPIASMMPDGLDALLSTVQMPPGIPVATVGVGGARNAALLAAQILALADPSLAVKLKSRRTADADLVRSKDATVRARFTP